MPSLQAEDRDDMVHANEEVRNIGRFLRKQQHDSLPGRSEPAAAIEELAKCITYNLNVNNNPLKVDAPPPHAG